MPCPEKLTTVAPLPIWFRLMLGLLFLALPASAQTPIARPFIAGDYDEVIKGARQKINDDDSVESRLLLIKSLLMTGRYAEAHTNALAACREYPVDIRTLLAARETALFQNDLTGANRRLV